MKKIYAIFGLALAMLTAGCAKDATEDVAVGGKVILGVGIENTRTSLGALNGTQHPILWSEGDKIAVNGEVSSAVTAQHAGTSYATFEVANVAAPYSILYPAEILGADGNITVATEQAYTANSFASGSAVMVGYAEANPVTLHNLYSFVKVTVAKGDDVALKSVTLTALGGEAISGTFAVDYKAATIAPLAGKDLIRVSSADGIPYVDGKASVIIAVPAGEYAKGFNVKVVDAAGKAMEKKAYTTAGVAVPAGVLLNMPEFTYTGVAQSVISVTNAAELQAVMAQATAEFTGTVVLDADIDMTGVTITPVAEFNGVFDGQGYALKNWTSSEGLFTLNNGTIKNIVIDESCVLTLPVITETSMIGFITDQNTGLVYGCVNNADINLTLDADLTVQYKTGAIVGYSSGAGKVSNCTNNGDITLNIPAITGGSDYVGGVVGNTSMSDAANIAVENCINTGDITVTVQGGSKNMYLGGISGACNSKGIINNCINNGTVTYNFGAGGSGAYPNQGGIVGYTACSINNCKNYGDVVLTIGPATTTRPAVAGIAGYVSKNVTNCENYGDIKVTGTAFGKASSATAAGAGGEQWPAFGGCFGCVGNVASGDTADISDCNNYGNILVVNPAGTCRFGAAGVVAEPCGNVVNCHNYGDVDITGGSQVYLGGVVGYHYTAKEKVMENCSNEGNILLREGTYYYGGSDKDVSSAAYQYVGGLVGSFNSYTSYKAINCENKGEVKSIGRLPVLVGGLMGCLRGSVENCTNYGNVVCENGHGAKLSAVSGITGFGGGSTVNCANYGDVTLTNATGLYAATAFGGVFGNTEQSHTGITLSGNVTSNLDIALLVAGQNNNGKTVTLGTAAAPIVIDEVSLNGVAVTAENLATTTMAVNTEEENVANLVYEVGTTVVMKGESSAPALSVDGKRWALPASFSEVVVGVPTAVCFVDMGVTLPGKLIVALDGESAYGADAAGIAMMMQGMMFDYTVETTDASSGKVVIKQVDHFGDAQNVELPYSNLTAESVTVDFTNMLGNMGITVCECTLFTKEVTVQ